MLGGCGSPLPWLRRGMCRRRVVGTKGGSAWAAPTHAVGAEGAGMGQEEAMLIAEASAPSLPTRQLPAPL